MPAKMRVRLNSRAKVTGSGNKTIPSIAVPIAPIPIQAGSAVPTGSDFSAIPSNARLIIIAHTVPIVGHIRVNPSVYLSPTAHPISNSPATTKITQFIMTSKNWGVVPLLEMEW